MITDRSLCILVAEDHDDTLAVMARLLRGNGYAVLTARTRQEALALAAANRCDVLIADTELSDGGGLDLMRSLRASHNLKGIAVSGYTAESDVRAALAAGFEKYLAKPFHVPDLLAAIEDVVR